MFYGEHPPPHFHARYGDHRIVIRIEDFSVLAGYFPPRALGLVMEWAARHREELLENWELAANNQPLNKIVPLA